jgi:lipopolysaccharide transport system ATP-binding protein
MRVRDLCKVYRRYRSHWSLLAEILTGRPRYEPHHALRDVSFEVSSGEAFGVIGDNGAGKSTLLRILCGTAYPSRGDVEITGATTALLDPGAGFHQDFTGRENIRFTGSIMGFSREAVLERESEIIRFSELDAFIDQPVKTYSSGMAVRLGFAVATAFDPNLLIIDEVLAVGDQGFQKKCTDRIMGYRREGKTIVFCSHNLYQVRKLCDRVLWLDRGRVRALGPAGDVVDRYGDRILAEGRPPVASTAPPDPGHAPICRVERHRLSDARGEAESAFRTGDTLSLEVWARFTARFEGEPGIGVSLLRNDGTIIFTTSTGFDGFRLTRADSDLFFCRLVLPNLRLLSGSYAFTLMATDGHNMQVYDAAEEVEAFTVRHEGPEFGVVSLEHYWREV